VDIYQFYNAANRIALAVESSGLLGAVRNCRAVILDGAEGSTTRDLAEAMLLRAGGDYSEHATRFALTEQRVATHFHLQELSSPEYWKGLTESNGLAARQGELVSLYSRLLFVSNHLPRLLAFVDESGAIQSDAAAGGQMALVLRHQQIADGKIESAADPDRIARVIDAVNMVYRGAALLAGAETETLELGSVSGSEQRVLRFRGQRECTTAVCRIIQHLHRPDAAPETNIEAGLPVDAELLVADLPFLGSLDELERIGALSPELTDDIKETVTAGAIMLVEAGAGLGDVPDPVEAQFWSTEPHSAEAEVEAHYLDHFDAVRERMLGDAGGQGEAAPQVGSVDTQPAEPSTPAPGSNNGDDLDDLIVDLNKLYKR
jgi:hypothetical protein